MKRKIKLPPLGEGVEEAVVIEWTCAVGERIQEGEPLLSVELDKIDTDVPSPVTGTVSELAAAPGDVVTVGQIICTVES